MLGLTSDDIARQRACARSGHKLPNGTRYDCLRCGALVSLPVLPVVSVGVLAPIALRVIELCDYVGDHGGGERECSESGCVSCEANAIARDMRALVGGTS